MAVIGGNTGKPNTFTGVNIADLTGGVFNAETLLEGNNLMCYGLQLAVHRQRRHPEVAMRRALPDDRPRRAP